ncbi:MAG: hypothetical protein A3J09_00465 [Candidatus Zambryskibacteria bacterium RIFCSPLOWO2_02_FULL_51_21]|nr:MAG: hypothetical protein A3J09_00465 [Candidatus Zambryskibacteria bacterium RIFCSPLOWO2_02_FULL_51_21]
MNYLQRNRPRSPIVKLSLVLLGLFAAGTILLFFLSGPVISLVSPLWRSETWVGTRVSGFLEIFRTKNSLISENARLSERLAALEIELAAKAPGLGENESVAALLGRRQEEGGVAASVLARPPQIPYDTFIIDAGSRDTVAAGERVFMSEGPLLGTIADAFASSAKVRLLSTSGEKTAAVLERHGIPVTLEGAGGGNFRVTVPRETEVSVGDRILSADIAGRLVAVVGDVAMEPTDSFKQVLAVSPANIFNIRFVLIRP